MSGSPLLPPTLPAPGWYHDGSGLRWWDGLTWGPYAPPAEAAWTDDGVESGRTLAILSHVGFFFAGIVMPLVLWATEGRRNPYVRHHSAEALNFQLTFLLAWVAAFVALIASTAASGGGGWFLAVFAGMGVLWLTVAGCAIVGAVRAGQGRWWRYPLSIRFVRGARAADKP
jgi:uncharacterized Tic20 family protein